MKKRQDGRRIWIACFAALLVLSVWQIWSCGGKVELGVEVEGQRLDVVDMHLHPGEWGNIPTSTQTFISSRFPWPLSLLSRQVTVRVYHAESGQGALAHPLGGPITTWTFQNKGTFTEKVGVPTQQGRGLVVYAWLDEDEDDAFCAIGKSPELSGIVELKEFPKHQISFQLALSATCAGPEALYP